MDRRLFGVASFALLAAGCNSSSRSSSSKKKDDDEESAPERDPLDGWVSAAIGDVSAKFPETPERSNEKTPNMTGASLIAARGDDSFLLMVAEYSVELEETRVLQGMRVGAFAGMKNSTLTHRDVQLKGMNGVEARATTGPSPQGLMRSYFDATKRRSILISAVCNVKWDEDFVVAYLDSLKIG